MNGFEKAHERIFGYTDAGQSWDGEEIVRCRDCEHMHTVRNWLGMNVYECWLHSDRESGAFGKVNTELDGFCKWAKRREEQS